MKKTALLLCLTLVIGLPVMAKGESHNQNTTITGQLTPEMWDQRNFAPLGTKHKMIVIDSLREMQKCFQGSYEALDKGVDTFMKSYQEVMQCYNQLVTAFVPHPEMCGSMSILVNTVEAMLPVMKALEILPAADAVWEPVTRFLSTKGNVTEQDPKRLMNKVFRNKEVKAEMKTILKKQCAALDAYVAYINKNYAQEVAGLEEFKAQAFAQMQELFSKMQEQQGQ